MTFHITQNQTVDDEVDEEERIDWADERQEATPDISHLPDVGQ